MKNTFLLSTVLLVSSTIIVGCQSLNVDSAEKTLPAENYLTTWPWQQNVYTNRFTIMCETKAECPGLQLQFGKKYAQSQEMTHVAGCDGRCIYKARVALDGKMAGKAIPFRLAINGEPLGGEGSTNTCGEVKLWSDSPDESFSCSIWGDNQQGACGGDWDADRSLYITEIFKHMMKRDVDFGITTGDMASGGKYWQEIKPLVLDRTDMIFGRYKPYYVAWGNHDEWCKASTKKYFETGSLDDPQFGSSDVGAYYLYRGNVLFIFAHWNSFNDSGRKWLKNLLATERAKNAKFRVLSQHAPMYLEVWGNNLNQALLQTAIDGGVDMVFGGHMHGYERIERNGIIQITNGGAGYLDHKEHVVNNYGDDTKVGGHNPVPYLWARQAEKGVLGKMQPVRMGCIMSYGELLVDDNRLRYRAHGFNADGSYIGVFDDFTITSRTVMATSPVAVASKAHCKNPDGFAEFTKRPVTNTKWKEFTDAMGDTFDFAEGSGDEPVTGISKKDIKRFLTWLNGKNGKYRLPTADELLKIRGNDLAGKVSEWTDSVDEKTGWCRIIGGNSLAEDGLWCSPTNTPAIATEDCFANYLGFRLVNP